MTKIKTRFAPSPTGFLHIGNARTALICYLYAKKHGGEFLLRIDDTDIARSKQEYTDAIKEDLVWLGLKWDESFRQSERLSRYDEVKKQLLEMGRLYPCYETAVELEVKRKMQMKLGRPPIYDRASLNLSAEKKAEYEAGGRKPHYRFLMQDGKIEWDDLVRGKVSFEAKNLGDPILLREDGSPTYLLPSAIDDVDSGITHIVRGEDHVTNTAVQIQIFAALGANIPVFAHLALLKAKDAKISKREGGFEIKHLRESGIEAMAINSFLARMGTSEMVEARTNLEDIIKGFDISKFGRAPTTYDEADLSRLNIKLVQAYSFAEIKLHLAEMGLSEIDENFWKSVQPNLKTLAEIKDWWKICNEKLAPVIEDAEFLAQAGNFLPDGQWDETTWNAWMDKLKAATGRQGKNLFMPIRKAITGMEHGPELKNLLPLIGREKVLARLNGEGA